MIYVQVPGVLGGAKIAPYKDKGCFAVTSFSFNVEREIGDKDKAGTEDVNVGIVEMQEISMSKNMDQASMSLAKAAISGDTVGCVEVFFVQTFGEKNVCYMHFKLDTTFIKSWSVSGDSDEQPTEDFTLWYNKMAFIYFQSVPDSKGGTSFVQTPDCAWDVAAGKKWTGAALEQKADGS